MRKGIDIQVTKTIAAVGTIEVLPKGGYGYQELGMTGKAAATASGLSTTTQYYVTVAINGGTATEYDITTAADVTLGAVIALLNAAISGVTFEIINGDVRCTSDTKMAGSAIALTAGTTGTDLLATLTDCSVETAVKPSGTTYCLTEIDIGITAYADTGVLSLSDGTTVWFGPWLCKSGNGHLIPLKWADGWQWTTEKPLQLICATANVGARITVKGFVR